MKKTVLYILTTFIIIIGYNENFSQCNLVRNGNFEQYTNCPTALSYMHYVNDWHDATTAPLATVYPSSDYFNCSFNSVSSGASGAPAPSGTGFVGLNVTATYSTAAEMIGTCVNLRAGVTYTVSLYMKGAFDSGGSNPFYIMGVPGSTFPVPVNGSYCPITMTQLVTITKAQAYNANWTQRTYTFTSPANFGGIIIGGVCSSTSNYYIYIDNFSLTTTTPTDYASITSNVTSVPCGGGNANITFNLPGGCLAPYNVTYTVNGTPTTINSINNGHTITLPISTSSTVVLTNVTNADGCSFNPNSSVSITTSAGVTANAGSNQTVNCTTPSATLNGSASGGTPSYSYSWSPTTGLSNPNIANPVATPSSTTTYTLTVTDGASCTSTSSTTVTVNNTPPTANAGSNQTINCTTTSVNLNGSGSGSYSWSPSTGLSSTTVANPTATPASTQTYTLTVTGTNGCQATSSTTVTVDNSPPTANAGTGATVNCTSPSVVLSGSGTGTYSWSPTTGLSSSTIATPTATPTSNTTYTLTVTGSNGCQSTSSVTVNVDNTPPSVNAGSDFTTSCTTPTATLNGSGSGSLSWSPATGLSSTTISNPVANPAASTTYTLTVTGTNGCTATDQAIVTVDKTPPSVNAGGNQSITCTNTSVVLNGSGSGTYSWSPATGLSSTTIATPTATPTTNTTYTLTVTGANGCQATSTATVNIDTAPPTVNAGTDFTTSCTNPSTVLNGSGSGTYSWSPATGLSSTTVANPTATPSVNTNYILTVTGANGCTATDDVNISVDVNVPAVDAGTDFTTTCTTPTTTLNGSGGGTFSWSPAAGLSSTTIPNPVADPTTTTTYTLTVLASNGCTASDQVVITVDETAPTASIDGDILIDCANTNDTFTASGGGSYSWNTPSGTQSGATVAVSGSSTPGTYTVTVTGTNGCTSTTNATLIVDQVLPNADAGPSQVSNCAAPTVVLDGSASSGAGITYSWTGPNIVSGANSSTPSVDAPGLYILTVTGANSCQDTSHVNVIPDTNYPVIDLGTPQVITCQDPVVTVGGTNTTTGTDITYSWSTSDGQIVGDSDDITAQVDLDGTYTITVTNTSNGCTSVDDAVVTIDTITPVVSSVADNYILNCNVTEVSFDVSQSSGTGNSFSWTTLDGNFISGQNSATPIVDSDGTYSLVVTSANGCENTSQYEVVVVFDTVHPTVTLDLEGVLTCELDSVILTAVSNIDGHVNWTFDNVVIDSSNLVLSTINSGIYTFSMQDTTNGCLTSSTIEVIDECDLSDISIPNVFTPNGDGENDIFFINITGDQDLNCQIFNRWGQLIYEWDAIQGGWDGFSVSGVECPEGTYYYVLNVKTPTEEETVFTGNFHLKR